MVSWPELFRRKKLFLLAIMKGRAPANLLKKR
jgi:hypothetical protein